MIKKLNLQLFATGSSVATAGQDLKTAATVTYARFQDETEAKKYYDRVLKEALYTEYTAHKYFDEVIQPKHMGKTYNWSTQDKMVASINALVEGVVPSEDSPNNTYWHQATLSRYAGWIRYTDEMDIFSLESGLPTKLQKMQGQAVGEQFQNRAIRYLMSSKSRWFAGIAPNDDEKLADLSTARANCTKFDLDDFRKIKTFLKRNRVKPFDGTHYLVLVSPEVTEQLFDLTKGTTKYTFTELALGVQDKSKIYDGVIGAWNGFVFVEELSIGEVAESKTGAIHNCVILGKKNGERGAKILKLEGFADVETIIKPLGSAGSNDPVNQIGTIGWKQNGWGAFIAYDEAVTIYECRTDYEDIYTEVEEAERSTVVEKYVRANGGNGNKQTVANTEKIENIVQGNKEHYSA